MTTSSSFDDFIKSHNPFNPESMVKKHHVWGEGFPDVPSINAHVSDAVFDALHQVQNRQREVIGITIKAEKGLGKTHTISRLRHRLQVEGGAWFVYMCEYSNLNKIKPEFLDNLAYSLNQVGSQGVTQWQELATALLNEVYQKKLSAEQFVSRFPVVLAKNPKIVDNLTDKVLENKPDIENPYLIKAIIWTLSKSPKHSLFVNHWLAGKGLSLAKAEELGLPSSTDEDRDTESFRMICQILDLISQYNPLVICFDQIEGTETNERGFSKPQIIANFGMDLYNSLKRGVILTALYPEIWSHQIKALPAAAAVIDRIGEKLLELKYLNPDDVVALVSRWLQDFYQKNNFTPPNLLYPFNESQLRSFGQERPSPRTVLKWCKENWKIQEAGTTESNTSKDSIEELFQKEISYLEDEDLLENQNKIAKALTFSLNCLIGQETSGVFIESIESPVKPKSRYLDFKIIGKENNQPVTIGVAVIQEAAGNRVQAGIGHLIDYEKYKLTRGCLVRSKEINRKAKKAQEYLHQLIHERGGKQVKFQLDSLKLLAAIYAVYDSREDYEVTEAEIIDFIKEKRLALDNALIQEILSPASGQVLEETDGEKTEDNLEDEGSLEENFADIQEVLTVADMQDDLAVFTDDHMLDQILVKYDLK